ncbi:MAG: hypothetical protein K0R15_97 [Clostridiales bacterium]|jgi:stage III sporulation protein AH|nr:hypothetical protein [Clostridiales bacterium]
MNLLKKNQVVITALVIMVTIAGYLSYTQKNLPKDAQTSGNPNANTPVVQQSNDLSAEVDDLIDDETPDLTNDGAVVDNENTADPVVADGENTDPSNAGEAVFTNTQITASEYFIQAKFNREQARAKGKETYLELINNPNLSEAQKNEAILQMLNIADNVEKEATAEDLLQAKGFVNAMVRISEKSVDVVVTTEQLKDEDRAQIEDIVKRATSCDAGMIVITPVRFEKEQ